MWWQVAPVAWVDRSAAAGSHSYRVTVSDPFGNEVALGSTTATSSGPTAVRPYAAAVQADGASDHWSLGERSGTAASDSAGLDDLVGSGGIARGAAGAIRGDADGAASFTGASGFFASQTPRQGLHTVTVEAWFSTRSTAGGKIVGFGDQQTGLQRQLRPAAVARRRRQGPLRRLRQRLRRRARLATAYNNGSWHHVVATLGPTGHPSLRRRHPGGHPDRRRSSRRTTPATGASAATARGPAPRTSPA